ncbi:unnamed protein product [Pseudo-nitzschia multistriata]|uniref:Uncharacterized protein n=1 Tax=Pseudo-nitzschia multistriata TaxID=183589 RepID=A0A448ZGN5_9STRA|nr:unnamed protein product [Pseudo-nitzschia multistriata]
MAVDPSTGELINNGQSPRFKLWLAFFAFSTIVMGSAVGVKKRENQVSSNSVWAVFCSAFSFTVTGVVTMMHLSPMLSDYIVGTKWEGIITVVLAAFWSATVAVVANAATGLAVDASMDNTIVNGNLYYFSWAGFVTSILLIIEYLRGVFGVDVYGTVRNRAARLTLWAGLLACQLVVLGASANIFDTDCTDFNGYAPESAYCKRTKYGLSLGVIGTLFSLVIVAMKMLTTVAPVVVEGVLAFVLCIMNGCGVAFLTSAEGPGSPIGNLYYFSWFSWLVSFVLLASVYEDYRGMRTPENEEVKVDGEIPVEAIDDV